MSQNNINPVIKKSENKKRTPKKLILNSYMGFFKSNKEDFEKFKELFTIGEYKGIILELNSIIYDAKKELKSERKVEAPKVIRIMYFWSRISIYLFILLGFIGLMTYSYAAMILSILCVVYCMFVFSGLFFINYFAKQPVVVSFEEKLNQLSKPFIEKLNTSYNNLEFILFSEKDPYLKISTKDSY
jgi:hypothetical protein